MHRFFVGPKSISGDTVIIAGEAAHRIREVLRQKVSDVVTVLDNTGMEYRVQLEGIERDKITGRVTDKSLCGNEPDLEITIYQSLLKADRFELVLQKCTEIGVTRFVPVVCYRCIVDKPSNSRFSRWQKIVMEAAEQSKRGTIPEISEPMDFRGACETVGGYSLMPWEQEAQTGIQEALENIGDVKQIGVFIGPEGGFTFDEVGLAKSNGVIPVTLGKRILRAETAGLVTSAIILFALDELK